MMLMGGVGVIIRHRVQCGTCSRRGGNGNPERCSSKIEQAKRGYLSDDHMYLSSLGACWVLGELLNPLVRGDIGLPLSLSLLDRGK